jgi:hypothetical protein
MRASNTVRLIELDCEVQRIVPLGSRWRRVLASHFEHAHRKPDHRPYVAVPTDQLNAGITAVPPRQLDGLHIRPAHVDALVEHSAHGISPPVPRTFLAAASPGAYCFQIKRCYLPPNCPFWSESLRTAPSCSAARSRASRRFRSLPSAEIFRRPCSALRIAYSMLSRVSSTSVRACSRRIVRRPPNRRDRPPQRPRRRLCAGHHSTSLDATPEKRMPFRCQDL